MTRSDVHSPTNLKTEDYALVLCYSPKVDGAIIRRGGKPPSHAAFEAMRSLGWKHADVDTTGDCDHCGARCEYRAVLMHIPSREWIEVGEICLDNRFARATDEFQKLRKEAKLDREKERAKIEREKFTAEHPGIVKYLDDYTGTSEFVRSLKDQLDRKGILSARQCDAMERGIRRDLEWADKRKKEAEEAPPATKVIEGRIAILGKVLRIKEKQTPYGIGLKMLILDFRGFKVWGSVPNNLRHEMDFTGEDVELKATVQRSLDDDTFGFFSRPTDAIIVVREAEDDDEDLPDNHLDSIALKKKSVEAMNALMED